MAVTTIRAASSVTMPALACTIARARSKSSMARNHAWSHVSISTSGSVNSVPNNERVPADRAPCSEVEEDGLMVPLQVDVEAVAGWAGPRLVVPGDERRPPGGVVDRGQHRVRDVGLLVREVDPRDQPYQHAPAEHRHV